MNFRMTHSKGNALFLILIAVALFAALSYAITTSSRSGGRGTSAENARLVAGQIFQYASEMRAAVQRLQLINGCTLEQISFYKAGEPLHITYYANPNAPADGRCDVFGPDGAGLTYVPQWMGWNEYNTYDNYTHAAWETEAATGRFIPEGRGQFYDVGTMYGTELTVNTYYVNEELCRAYNRLAIQTTDIPPGYLPGFYGSWMGAFVGDGVNDSHAATTAPVLLGEVTACVENKHVPGVYGMYFVLVER